MEPNLARAAEGPFPVKGNVSTGTWVAMPCRRSYAFKPSRQRTRILLLIDFFRQAIYLEELSIKALEVDQ